MFAKYKIKQVTGNANKNKNYERAGYLFNLQLI